MLLLSVIQLILAREAMCDQVCMSLRLATSDGLNYGEEILCCSLVSAPNTTEFRHAWMIKVVEHNFFLGYKMAELVAHWTSLVKQLLVALGSMSFPYHFSFFYV